jgi:hypothetical protein
MLLYLGLGFPILLLGLLGFMEWIEAPLRSEAIAERLPEFLDTAPPEELEVFVSAGLKAALDRHWLRQRVGRRLLPGR